MPLSSKALKSLKFNRLTKWKIHQRYGNSKGITLIVGGGYHGKSTLLEALERGVYNHIAGDGRVCDYAT